MSMADRPARPARGKLTPPRNADVDPIDARPSASTPEPTRPTPPLASPVIEGKGASAPAAGATPTTEPAATLPIDSGLDVTVQSGIRWSPATEAIVRAAKARTGKTRRAIVEEAIARVWGD